jgi:structural maintenance of chromosome 3 (chondroitin sulfate proteoglycan 6)
MCAAGFSSSNPYYVVRQGEVHLMATCGDAQRLTVIKELTGDNRYGKRKTQAVTKLEMSDKMLREVEETLQQIDEDIEVLGEEKKKLEKFEKWDRKMRALKYTLNVKRIKKEDERVIEAANEVKLVNSSVFLLSMRINENYFPLQETPETV